MRTRPSSEEIEARTENNIVSALNGRQDFVVGHLAGEVDVRIDAEQNLMLVKGAVPGGKNALVQIRMA